MIFVNYLFAVPFVNHKLCGGGQYRRLVVYFADPGMREEEAMI